MNNKNYIPNNEIDELKKVDLAQFAINNYGYSLDKKGSTNTGISRLTRGSGEFMVVQRYKATGDYMYFTEKTTKRNNIYGLIKDEDNLEFAAAHKKYYTHSVLNMPVEQRQEKPKISKAIRKENLKVQPLTDTRYLESRGIDKSTLEHPQFKNRVFNKEVVMPGTGAKFKNTVYPLYALDQNGNFQKDHVGLEAENNNFKGTVEGSQKSGAVWMSNLTQPKKQIDEIIVVESPRDAMAKFQLKDQYESSNRIYVAKVGPVTTENSKVINRILEHSPDAKVVSALDNDRVGDQYDINLIKNINKNKNAAAKINIKPHKGGGLTIEFRKTTLNNIEDENKFKLEVKKAYIKLGQTGLNNPKEFDIKFNDAHKSINTYSTELNTTIEIRHPDTPEHWKMSKNYAQELTGVDLSYDKSYFKDWGEDNEVSKGKFKNIDITANKGKLSSLAQGSAETSINVTDSLKSLIQAKLSPKKKGIDLGQSIEI